LLEKGIFMGIGPSTKETSMHLFKDPLLDVLSKDPDIDYWHASKQ